MSLRGSVIDMLLVDEDYGVYYNRCFKKFWQLCMFMIWIDY